MGTAPLTGGGRGRARYTPPALKGLALRGPAQGHEAEAVLWLLGKLTRSGEAKAGPAGENSVPPHAAPSQGSGSVVGPETPVPRAARGARGAKGHPHRARGSRPRPLLGQQCCPRRRWGTLCAPWKRERSYSCRRPQPRCLGGLGQCAGSDPLGLGIGLRASEMRIGGRSSGFG